MTDAQRTPDGPRREAPPRPPRPPMSDTTPPPIVRAPKPTAATITARAAWVGSVLAGVLVIAAAFVRRTDQFDRLSDLVEKTQPGYDADTVATAAALLFWVTLATLAVLTVVEILLRPRTERRAGARWWMLIVLLLHLAVAVVGDGFIALGQWSTASRALLAVQLGLAAVGLLLTTIGARSLRRQDQPGRHPR